MDKKKIIIGDNIESIIEQIETTPSFKWGLQASFDGDKARATFLQNLMAVKKYRIAFIGAPGSGKTTAICNWLNLLIKDKSKVKGIKQAALLSTGSGRITLSEVHISQVRSCSKIVLSYLPIGEQETYIREACELYWYKILPSKDHQCLSPIPTELYGFILNMAKLNELSDGDSEDTVANNKEIMRYLDQFQNIDEFYADVLERIDLSKRVEVTEFVYDENEDFDKWLSREFDKINFGKNDKCSIMNKISIEVSEKDLDLGLPKYVSEVIDTLGLDSDVSSRSDIRRDVIDLLRADDTICFIVDDFNSVISLNIRNLLIKAFEMDADKILARKVSLFIRPYTDDEEEIKRKKSIIKSQCVQNNTPYLVENTLFIDVCVAYSIITSTVKTTDKNGNHASKKVRKIEYNLQDAQKCRDIINEHVSYLMKVYKNEITNEIKEIANDVNELILKEANVGGNLIKKILVAIRDYKRKLNESPLLVESLYRSLGEYIWHEVIENKHWRSKRATCTPDRYGTYRTCNIYDGATSCGESLFKFELDHVKDIIVGYYTTTIEDEDLRNLLIEGISRNIDQIGKQIYDDIGNDFKMLTEKTFSPKDMSNEFWSIAYEMEGKGYNMRINDHFHRKFVENDDDYAEIIKGRMISFVDLLIRDLSKNST